MAVEGCLHSLSLKHGPVRKQNQYTVGWFEAAKHAILTPLSVEMAFCYMFAVVQTELNVYTF
jgi:hypothetical protein